MLLLILATLHTISADYANFECCFTDDTCVAKASTGGSNGLQSTNGACSTGCSPTPPFSRNNLCTEGDIPVPTSGVWMTSYTDTLCTSTISTASMMNSVSLCGPPPTTAGLPDSVVSVKAVCTTGGGAQAWGYAARDCVGSPNFVYDLGASFASPTGLGVPFGTCKAGTTGGTKAACYGTPVDALPILGPTTASPSPTPIPACPGASTSAALYAGEAPLSCTDGVEFPGFNPNLATLSYVMATANPWNKLCHSVTGDCKTNTSCVIGGGTSYAPAGTTMRFFTQASRCVLRISSSQPPSHTHLPRAHP